MLQHLLPECTAEVLGGGWTLLHLVTVVNFGLWHSVPFLGGSVCCRVAHRLLRWRCYAWKNVGVGQGCFPSSARSPCTSIPINADFLVCVAFQLSRSIPSAHLCSSAATPQPALTDESSIICQVTIKASGLIWGSGPPLPFSLPIVLNPLMLQGNRTFIRWSVGGQGADNRFYCIWDIAVLFLRTARQIGNHGHG